MKIKPIILCGGEGTRLWPTSKNNIPKQFIDFGGWTLFKKTLERIKNPIFDYPIISTNIKYLNITKKHLSKYKVKKYTLVLEPYKKNTAAAILSSTLLKEVKINQPIVFFPSDHLIDKRNKFINKIKKNIKNLAEDNIFLFGIKPKFPSSQFGYILTKKTSNNINKVLKFIEKPKISKAKSILKKKGLWNSGILFANKISIINNFNNSAHQTLKHCLSSVIESKVSKNVYYLNNKSYKKIKNVSFDYAILEKAKNINSIILDVPWSDLGNWKQITDVFKKNKKKYFNKKNVFYRPWGKYTNLFHGNGFLIKELIVNPKSSISLQKHKFRSEHWTVASGRPKITINKNKFIKNPNDTVFISRGSIHRIENPFNKPVKIMEVQIGSILKETDIVRYKDIYGRVN